MTTISMLKGNENNNRTATVTAGETKEVRIGLLYIVRTNMFSLQNKRNDVKG